MGKFKYRFLYPFIVVLVSSAFLFTSCKKDEEDDEIIEERNVENSDFYELMQDWYYWYDQMPDIKPATYESPYEVLEALRKRPEDRWSYITSRKQFESYFVESKFIGYGFGSKFDPEGKLRVTFVYHSVDLYEKGVRRSWIIEEVNGTRITTNININQLLGANEVGVSNDFLFRKPDGTLEEMTVQKKEVIMNTVLHKEVIETGSRKVGYLVFQNFTTPSFEELEEAFDLFNSEVIDELILDLRYNGGGQTNVANYLGSIIGGSKVAGKPFAEYLYNDKQSQKSDFTSFFGELLEEDSPILDIERLVVIATKSTASASEMVINGLKPFFPVTIIGNDTYGKPMGMNAWYYGDKYAFVPVTFKIANADNFGDYFDGLQADSYVPDDITRMFGDPEEASFKEALNFIETGSYSGMPMTKSFIVQPYEHFTGLRREIGAH